MDLNPFSILSAIPQRAFIIVSVNPVLEPPDSKQTLEKGLGLRRVFQQPVRAADASLSE